MHDSCQKQSPTHIMNWSLIGCWHSTHILISFTVVSERVSSPTVPVPLPPPVLHSSSGDESIGEGVVEMVISVGVVPGCGCCCWCCRSLLAVAHWLGTIAVADKSPAVVAVFDVVIELEVVEAGGDESILD